MSFFDKLNAGITNAGRTMSQSVKNSSDTSRLQREISTQKQTIQKTFSELGQRYFEAHRNDASAEFADMVSAISSAMQRIDALQAEIQEVQNRKPDLVPVPQDEPKAPAVRPAAMVCMQCGATYDTTQVFCKQCGQKLTPQYPTPTAAAIAPAQTAADVRQIPVPNPAPAPNPVPAPNPAPAPNLVPTPNPAPAPDPAPAPNPVPVPNPAPAPSSTSNPAERFCPNCGAKAAAGSAFCTSCGAKL